MYCQNCKSKMIWVLYIVHKKKCTRAYFCTVCGELDHIKGTYVFRIWRGNYKKRFAFKEHIV
ncbi:MAG: hypothetical protein JG777_1060 [Clostridia bacterium]|jgi:hypothetical protein|nr:hypothetical protein [Clostridia bacterium]